MTPELLQKLLEYIDARIDEKLDDNTSADEGLTSALITIRIREELDMIVREEVA